MKEPTQVYSYTKDCTCKYIEGDQVSVVPYPQKCANATKHRRVWLQYFKIIKQFQIKVPVKNQRNLQQDRLLRSSKLRQTCSTIVVSTDKQKDSSEMARTGFPSCAAARLIPLVDKNALSSPYFENKNIRESWNKSMDHSHH